VFGPVSIAIGKNFTPVEFNATFFGLIIEWLLVNDERCLLYWVWIKKCYFSFWYSF
jgi:hypothetical protein